MAGMTTYQRTILAGLKDSVESGKYDYLPEDLRKNFCLFVEQEFSFNRGSWAFEIARAVEMGQQRKMIEKFGLLYKTAQSAYAAKKEWVKKREKEVLCAKCAAVMRKTIIGD